MEETQFLNTISDKIALATRKAGTLSGNIEYLSRTTQDRGIAETVELWSDYSDEIHTTLSKIETELDDAKRIVECAAVTKQRAKKELDRLHTKIVSLADSIDTTETVSTGTKEVWAKYASDIHDELEEILNKHF